MSTHLLRRTLVVAGLAGVLVAPAPVRAQNPPPETIEYYATDALGSVRVVFAPNGQVLGRSDYLPFGETFNQSGALPHQRFTGQERDGEAGLDYFNARSLQSWTGRFTAPDPLFSNTAANPQKWNRYSYVLNNPLRFLDPTGKDPCATSMFFGGFVVKCPQGPVQGLGFDASTAGGQATLGDRQLGFGPLESDGINHSNDTPESEGGGGTFLKGPDETVKQLARYNALVDKLPVPQWVKNLLYISAADLLVVSVNALEMRSMKVADILKMKKGSILQAPLEAGAPGWDAVLNMTLEQLEKLAKDNPAVDTMIKLLKKREYDRGRK